MSLEMVDPDERTVGAERQGLPIHHPDEQRADQPGAGSHRHSIQLRQSDSGVRQGTLDHRPNGLNVGPAGQLRNDPAEDPMHILREDCRARRARTDRFPLGLRRQRSRRRKSRSRGSTQPRRSRPAIVSISPRFPGEFQSCSPMRRFTMIPSLVDQEALGHAGGLIDLLHVPAAILKKVEAEAEVRAKVAHVLRTPFVDTHRGNLESAGREPLIDTAPSPGISTRQGRHQVAQILTRVTAPR